MRWYNVQILIQQEMQSSFSGGCRNHTKLDEHAVKRRMKFSVENRKVMHMWNAETPLHLHNVVFSINFKPLT